MCAAYAKRVFMKNVREIDYHMLFGFLKEDIIEILFGGATSASSVESHTEGMADIHQPSPTQY